MMAAVGELGAGVAHEINNPLMGVLGTAQLLLMRHPEGDPDYSMLVDLEREAQRIRGIVTRLLETSQTGRLGMARIGLHSLVHHVASQMEEDLKNKGVQLEVRIPDDLPPIMGNSILLEQALSELFLNAQRSMPDGGRIHVGGSGTPGEVVKLEVNDEGCGIPNEHLDRIFEPFFTNKQEWGGQGLGLSMVYNAIMQHHGKVKVESQEGKGTTFTLIFPAMRRETHLR
jgi:signal transduction histidine kinase